MGKALIIGAGGVAGVCIHKCCQNSAVFDEICIASRTKSKCDKYKAELEGKTKTKITTAQVDADDVPALTALIEKEKPDIVINLALPYQDLHIMDACLAAGVDYVDTANYEPEDTAKFEYKWQWAYRERFEKAGLTALLGSGFDPGVTSVFSAYAQKHYFDEIHYIDILDCNAGDHGYPFATNFNPEINIREVSAKGSYWENGKWVETEPMEIKRVYDFPEIGPKDMYLLHHEELESLGLNIKGIKRIRFFMTFGESYLTHLRCLENVGMTSIKPILFEGKEIFLKDSGEVFKAGCKDFDQYLFSGHISFYHESHGEFYQYRLKSWTAGIRRRSARGCAHHHAECDAAFFCANRGLYPGDDTHYQLQLWRG